MDLDRILPLRRASIYTNPLNPQAVLARTFGNYLDPNIDASALGFTRCECIDQENLIFQVNDGPAVTTFPWIYVNGHLQEPGVALWNPVHDFEGKGIVATLQFQLHDVKRKEISVRFGGSVDALGVPIVNPVTGLLEMFTRYGGWSINDFDRGPCEITARDMDALGYGFMWCFTEEKTIRDWLLELMPTYHTDFTETGNNQLSLILDRSLTVFPVSPAYHIPAYEIEDMGSPIQALRFTAHADDVANRVTLHGRHNWVTGASTASYTWDYLQSQAAYQAAYPVEFTFRGMYTMAHATQWLQSFAMRHGFEPRTVSFTLKGLKGIPLIFPRLVTVEWPLLGWSQHLLKIQKTVISWSGRRVRLDCIDCGRELSDAITSPLASPTQRRQQLSRVYNFVPGAVGDEGDLLTAPSDPKNECANGDFERGDNGQWDLSAGNAARQWIVVNNPATAHVGRYHLLHQLAMGTGLARSLRHRLDPGQWVLVSAWFRQHVGGTNGLTCATVSFYTQADQFITTVQGNPVVPSDTYLESILMVEPPPLTYYYRPGLGFASVCTTGQWRADYAFAVSGSQASVLASRQGDMVSRNFVINGDFELGDVMYGKDPGWIVTNNPNAAAHSGIWKAAHGVHFAGNHRLLSLTKVAVTPGQTFTVQVHVFTLNTPNGLGQLGVTWYDGAGMGFAENWTVPTAGPFVVWQLATAGMTVPAGAVSAQVWIAVSNHTAPVGSFWLFDDLFLSVA